MRFVAELGGTFNTMFGLGKLIMFAFGSMMILQEVVSALFLFDASKECNEGSPSKVKDSTRVLNENIAQVNNIMNRIRFKFTKCDSFTFALK